MSMSDPNSSPGASSERSDTGDGRDGADRPAPRWLLVLEFGYVVALALVAVLYGQLLGLRQLVPDPVGPIPIGVPWWGALGGVTISLTGIFRHRRDWDDTLDNWHIARPLLGAIMGSVGFLIFIVVIRSTGTNLSARATAGRPVYYLVAFLLGYREEAFRNLLRRAVDLLLSTGKQAGDT
jgi:hypothetical protein